MTLSLPSYLEQPAFRYRLEQARRLSATKSIGLTAYKTRVYHRYQHARHLAALDAALEQATRHVETGGRMGAGHIIVSMPPRHGKTITVSRLFPSWFLGRNPDNRVILASYGADLARKNSRVVRNLIAAPVYGDIFPGVRLADDSRAAEAFDLAGHDGGLDAVGVGGGLTGKGGHIIVVDDPIKSRAEAESKTYRDKVWDWFTDDLYTRREPGAAVIVVMTRWHADDLVGRLMKNEPGKWQVVCLPALAEMPSPPPPLPQGEGSQWRDALGRQSGEALWPERYNETALAEIEQTLGPYAWAALYQQTPVPAEGGIFKREWFKRVQYAPEMQSVVRFWDLAMSEKTSADFTAGVKMGIAADGHTYILDVVHERIDWGRLPEAMAQVMLADGQACVQGVEEKGYMSRAVQDLNSDGRLRGYAVFGFPKETDKLTNALPFAAKAAAGLVHVVDTHWTDDWIEELCSFPNAEHDDQVDAASGAWGMLAGGATMMPGSMAYADSGTIGGTY